MDTSLDFEFGSKVVEVPIERIGHDSAKANSPKTRLLSDNREFKESHE